MATINPPTNGSNTFPTSENEFYSMVETIARQEVRSVKSASHLDDAIFFYDLTDENGTVIEQALMNRATAQAFDPTGDCSLSPHDPDLMIRYFRNWSIRQYHATVRRDEIRKVIANKGTGVEDMIAEIIDTATQGNSADEFKYERDLILNAEVKDFSEVLGGTPKTMKGVVFAIREMYNYLKGDNSFFTVTGWKQHTPPEDIRIALSERVMNLIDVGELASVLNLSKEELFGKLVVIETTDQSAPVLYKIVAYDRKAFNRARRVYDIDNAKCANKRFTDFILTVEDMYFYSPLFKATSLDVSAAANAQFNELITVSQSSPQPANRDK